MSSSRPAAVRRVFNALAPRRVRHLGRDLRQIHRLATDPHLSLSYYPDEPRKSRARIIADLLAWRARRGEVNEYYYCWGMDRLNGPQSGDVLSYREFKALRDGANQRTDGGALNYIALMRDKYLFALLLDALGYPSPRLLALLRPDGMEWLRPRRPAVLESLLEVDGLDAFCKPRFGIAGQGAFRVQVDRGRIRINGREAELSTFAGMDECVLQQRLEQHPAVAALHAPSVNTLRLVTVRDAGTTRLFSWPVLRIGFGGNVVDNGTSGGIQAFVDADTGRLRGPGLMFRGGTVARHPDSGVALDGFQVPQFDRAVDMTVRLHHELPGLHSVGWDLAITAAGPVFIEGNDNWAAGLRLGLDPDFKREFVRVCSRP